jgi:hypothetical protein
MPGRNEQAERKRFLGTWKVVRTEFGGDGENPALQTFQFIHFTECEAIEWASESSEFGGYYDSWTIDDSTKLRQFNCFQKLLTEDPDKRLPKNPGK